MNSECLQTRAELAGIYQQQLQALAFEMRVAMQAIASNSLPVLEASVAKQEMLCHGLLKLCKRLQQDAGAPGSEGAFPSDPVEERAAATARSLRELNTQYASLLKHSGRSIAMLSTLCRSYTGQFPHQERRSLAKQQTWSCEM